MGAPRAAAPLRDAHRGVRRRRGGRPERDAVSGYGPPTVAACAALAAVTISAVVVGLCARRAETPRTARAIAWTHFVTAVAATALATRDDLAGDRMMLLCVAIFLSMKVVVTTEARLDGRPLPSVARWLAFLFLWPGMRPWAFARSSTPAGAESRARREGSRLVLAGVLSLAAGGAAVVAARAISSRGHVVPATLVLLVGLSLVVHFGVFRVLAGAFRLRGLAVAPLFDRPHRSRSLSEFWSRRWNLAFSEMAQVAVHRPLAPRIGAGAA